GRFQSHCPVQDRFGHVTACPQPDHRPSIPVGLFHHHGRRGYPQQSLSAPGAVRNPAAAGRSFSGRFGQGRSGTPQAQCRRPERRRWGSRQRHSGNCQRNSEGTMKKVLLALLITVFPAQVWAGGCGCGSVRAIVTAAKSETIQAVNAYTATEAQAIRSEILLAAQNIIGTIKTESATIVRALVALKESNAATLKGQAVAGEAMKTEDMYGKAAQPAGLCGSSSLGAGIQLGAQARQEIHATMREKQLAHANTPGKKPVDFL